ncbi:hypothetical protein PS706_00436 [Pseudomonas fluorescens]|nr:hypothetical protein SAMN05216248_101119 [Pseudomonas simiae]VVN71073.1 hypothetical protein PS706_00436 [Pseudomonas fluorescens]
MLQAFKGASWQLKNIVTIITFLSGIRKSSYPQTAARLNFITLT